MERHGGELAFELPIGLATAEWIRTRPDGELADALRAHLGTLELTVVPSDELLQPLAYREPLDGVGSLLNLAEPNRVFDALFRWSD